MTNSTKAKMVKMATAHTDPIKAKEELCRLIQPIYAAQATTAGAVKVRRPATTPMPSANNEAVNPEFMIFLRTPRTALASALRQGQPYLKTCISRLGLDLNVATVLLHNALHGIEAQPGSLPDALRREEGLEGVWPNLGRNPRTVIANLHHNAIVLAIGAHSQLTLSAHRVNGVVDDVGPDLVELAAKRIHEKRYLLIVPLHRDPALELVIQNGERSLQRFHDIHVLHGRLIHERVFLDRAHELGDPRGTVFNLI